MMPHFENLTNPLIAGSKGHQEMMPQSVRGNDNTASLSDPVVNCYFDQHSNVAGNGVISSFKTSNRRSNDVTNSPGTMQTQSKQSILRFSNN